MQYIFCDQLRSMPVRLLLAPKCQIDRVFQARDTSTGGIPSPIFCLTWTLPRQGAGLPEQTWRPHRAGSFGIESCRIIRYGSRIPVSSDLSPRRAVTGNILLTSTSIGILRDP